MRLIDADALMAQMKEYHEKRAEEANMTGDRVVCVTWHDAVILIKSAPTVDDVPERKVGKWEQKEDPYGFFDTIPVCSVCGHTTKMRETYAYCPNCGAEMEVET